MDANTFSAKTKIFDTWENIQEDHDSDSDSDSNSDSALELKDLAVTLMQKWKSRPIVIFIDEIYNPDIMLKSLAEPSESFPANVTIIAVLNPRNSKYLPTLPEFVLQINLTTPYRSTIAITSLARFLVKSYGLDVPEVEFGSDVQGKKPIAFDVGEDGDKLKMALQRSREQLGDDATLLYDGDLSYSMIEICESHGKEKGGPWECYHVDNFFGWEAERVVAVTTGLNFLEMATRAKRELILILAEPERRKLKKSYHEFQMVIKTAEEKGLVDLKVIEIENQIDKEVITSEKTIENTSNTAKEDARSVIESENNYFLCCSA